VASERIDPIDRALPAAVAPIRSVLLTPAEREADRRRREQARAARAAQDGEGGHDGGQAAPDGAAPRLDVRG
jgi:hypothetical protein